ncbi:hypothetical protein HDF19_13245 [Mucilaginibacter sp. E4BP6]|uniref:hypothetical protein n=1 Tax=Mucilaginibacter sp. E4BP6 TaxID=2723089 RepID=UPI0015CA12F5|nr:hypothetical protein [Mucilaginibacter sp. E4BP6]NYE66056.1 hypothetical protein [Mucilaginibacter sp. E4BP6]
MNLNSSTAIIFGAVTMIISSCHGLAGYGTIDYHQDQDNVVLFNTSTDKKITFVIEENCERTPGPDSAGMHTFKEETTVSPQEQQVLGPIVDGVGTKWQYKIIAAYNADQQP